MKELTWESRQVEVSAIDPTPKNYKIRTDVGRERLRESLKQFGMAGNTVVNYHPAKKKRYVLIDGNSRLEEARDKKVKRMWVSVPNRPLTSKEFKLMSAMFDFAKAGEVDVDRIKGELGSSKQFFDVWKMEIPMGAIDKIGKRGKVVPPSSGKKTKGADTVGTSNVVMRSLFFSQVQANKFDKRVEQLKAKWKMKNITEVVLKAVMK